MPTLSVLSLLPLLFLGTQQDPARERLDASPRHHEWVEVKSGDRPVRCFVVYPEKSEKALAVLVIHENKGLTDWVRSVADQLAEAGCIAIAPDLLSGMGPKEGGTESFESTDAATKAIYALDAARVTADLNAVADHVAALPSCSGKIAVAGFCWGGSQSFAFATQRADLQAAFVFYGRAPEEEAALAKIACPVHGFYGENDARVTSTVQATTEAMKKLEKRFEPVVYPGAGHGFLRIGETADASEPDRAARAEAWKRWKELLAPAH